MAGDIRWVGGVAFVCENEREARELGVWGIAPPLGAGMDCAMWEVYMVGDVLFVLLCCFCVVSACVLDL
jgi:hypothetical protein